MTDNVVVAKPKIPMQKQQICEIIEKVYKWGMNTGNLQIRKPGPNEMDINTAVELIWEQVKKSECTCSVKNLSHMPYCPDSSLDKKHKCPECGKETEITERQAIACGAEKGRCFECANKGGSQAS